MASRRESPLYHFRDEDSPRTQQVSQAISYVTKEDLEAFGKSLILSSFLPVLSINLKTNRTRASTTASME